MSEISGISSGVKGKGVSQGPTPGPQSPPDVATSEKNQAQQSAPATTQAGTPFEFRTPYSPSAVPENFGDPSYTQQLLEIASEYLQIYLDAGLLKPKMPQLFFVDGSFAELAQSMADIVQVGDQVKPLLEKEQKEDALAAIVKASGHLNSIAEKDFNPSYNLLTYLVLEFSKDPKKYLPTMCANILKPITSSPLHHFTLASNALTNIFNNLDEENPLRYNVFMQMVRLTKQNNSYELIKPMLKNIPGWLKSWDTEEEAQRNLYVELAEVASEGGDDKESYHFLLNALATFDADDKEEVTSEEAQRIALRAVRMALLSTHTFLFQDLSALAPVQALADSHPVYSSLLDIFNEQDLEDYSDFKEENEGFIEKEKLDDAKLERKMRLLTFASLAASTPNREIPYENIAKALMVPVNQVELWSIDVIRAGLVEGRLSQQKKVFLVHRTTYRVFGEKQWRELGTRVDQYKDVVDNLLAVVRRQQAEAAAQKERDQAEIERKLANASLGGDDRKGGDRRGGRGGFGGKPRDAPAPKERDDNDD